MTPDQFMAIRRSAGLRQRQLAEHLGLSGAPAVSNYETGRTIIPHQTAMLMRLIDSKGLKAFLRLKEQNSSSSTTTDQGAKA